jgi:hypothetical protein
MYKETGMHSAPYCRGDVKPVRWGCPSTSPPAAVTLRTNGEKTEKASPVRAERSASEVEA